MTTNEGTQSRETQNNASRKLTLCNRLEKISKQAEEIRIYLLDSTRECEVVQAIEDVSKLVDRILQDEDLKNSLLENLATDLAGSIETFRMHDTTRERIAEMLDLTSKLAAENRDRLVENARLMRKLFGQLAENAEVIAELLGNMEL